ncbi:MarR family transcriptional regulator [Deinococcus wulumuqiensis]|uniref:MarR family transcriptional regulator n=1 Tax=Deinococcus wulumuqiensis TaxID=980427 RepID=A0AAV4K656_9DEIO|nr:MarR family transcriptional regulator [Deinococcus wulumuqiensis]QII20076.1 MarR family transcriptional regulator [Deinococcus wulumuqiensis R12]GGI87422.1 hypothetical protein GCM10010914_22380 [Deinococcus wulumuqiensis]GGP30011.1 hypothetical protein GCM10008021_16620 [Deinococcus wulumuqiensis]
MPRHPRLTDRDIPELTALVLRLVLQSPDALTVNTLSTELGESPRRIQRTLTAAEAAGWIVTRTGKERRLTLS